MACEVLHRGGRALASSTLTLGPGANTQAGYWGLATRSNTVSGAGAAPIDRGQGATATTAQEGHGLAEASFTGIRCLLAARLRISGTMTGPLKRPG
jgi:hypothetical protein